MISFSNLYSHGAHKRNIGHFADIVKLALLDGEIKERENELLNKLAKILGITNKEHEDIVANPSKYRTTFATSYEERVESFYHSVRMLLIDGQVSEEGVVLIKRIATGLGFHHEDIDVIVPKAINLFLRIPSIEEFKEAITVK